MYEGATKCLAKMNNILTQYAKKKKKIKMAVTKSKVNTISTFLLKRESHVVAKMQGEISMVMHMQGWILSVKIGR